MAKNIKSSQGYRRNGENSVDKEGLLSTKSKCDKNLLVVPFQDRSKACEFAHFLLYNYLAIEFA